MNVNELLKIKPVEQPKDFSILEHHFPEIPSLYSYIWTIETKRIQIDILKNHYFDHRRCWKLAILKLDNIPIAILQNAGREGDDYYYRFIINEGKFMECVRFLQSLQPMEIDDCENSKIISDLDEDIEELTEFYGYNLDSIFNTWE